MSELKLKTTSGGSVALTPEDTSSNITVTVPSRAGTLAIQDSVSVLDFGAVGDGVTDDTAAIQASLLAAVGTTLFVPRGTYKITSGITLSGLNTALICDPGVVFNFNISGNTTDCLTLDPSGYEPLYIENLTITCNNTGRDGLAFSKGAPKLKNVTINQPYRDGIAATLNSASSHWVENLTVVNLLITAAGRHPLHVYMTGAWSGTPFFNETLIEQFEVRGIGRNFANASAIRFTFDGTTTAPISGFTVLQCNFDAQVSSAVAPVSHTIYATSVNSGVGSIESLFIKGGGWESTSGTAPGGLYNYSADATITTKISNIVGIVNYNWAYSVDPLFSSEKSNYYADANGSQYPSALQKTDGYAFKAVSGLLGGFTNNPTAYRTNANLVASGNTNVDISIGAMSDYSAQAPIIVTIFSKPYYDGFGFYAYSVYLVSPSRTTTNYVHNVVLMSGSANPAYSFNPASVTFSIPSNGTLRVTVPGGASVGTAGANTQFNLSANRMFVDLPGVLTSLTL